MSQATSSFVRKSYKLFVGNLAWTVGNRELQMYFSRFGSVNNAAVIFDKQSGFSKNYGFVVFATREGFINASNHSNHLLDGKVLRVHEANN